MADGSLLVRLRNYEGKTIQDIPSRILFRRNLKNVGDQITDRRFASGQELFKVPAFPLAEWDCWVAAKRYEVQSSGFFRPQEGQVIERELWLPRNAKAGWRTRFVHWNDLAVRFGPLRDLLANSPNLKLKLRNGKTTPLGNFTGDIYDNDDDDDLREGKMGMLNMYAKLMATEVPSTAGSPWFSGIQRLLGIQRDRVVGIVSPAMANSARQICDNLAVFPTYREADTGQHFEKNIEPLISPGFTGKTVYSVKTRESIGVLQLVIAEVTYPQGPTQFFLDADVDENGNLLKHFADFIGHQFNGGTHPVHVHDLLYRTLKAPLLAYELT
jgi:hypothetical protein